MLADLEMQGFTHEQIVEAAQNVCIFSSLSHSIAELLLDLGADTEYCNKAGKTRLSVKPLRLSILHVSHSFISLMEATYNGHLECVKLLTSRGASWSKRDQSGEDLATLYSSSSRVAANLIIVHCIGMSALHWAVDGGHEGVVYHALNEEGVKVWSNWYYCPHCLSCYTQYLYRLMMLETTR